jgi:serine/threonine protein kinase
VFTGQRSLQRIGTVVGDRYRLTQLLGRGGFGDVYRAVHIGTRESVALKVLRADARGEHGAVERFTAEARLSASLRHPNTVRVFDFGQTPDGELYLAMEYLGGDSLETLVEGWKALAARRVVRIAVQVLKSLQEAHGKRIVHRDLKPANIFISDLAGEADFVHVIDFGIAKFLNDGKQLTQSGAVLGTPHFMSPEQARGDQLDDRSDVYGLGCVMYRCLTGRFPFDADNTFTILAAHLTEKAPPMVSLKPGIDPVLEGIVAKSMEKDRDKRFRSADEMRLALEAWQRSPVAEQDAPGDEVSTQAFDILTPDKLAAVSQKLHAKPPKRPPVQHPPWPPIAAKVTLATLPPPVPGASPTPPVKLPDLPTAGLPVVIAPGSGPADLPTRFLQAMPDADETPMPTPMPAPVPAVVGARRPSDTVPAAVQAQERGYDPDATRLELETPAEPAPLRRKPPIGGTAADSPARAGITRKPAARDAKSGSESKVGTTGRPVKKGAAEVQTVRGPVPAPVRAKTPSAAWAAVKSVAAGLVGGLAVLALGYGGWRVFAGGETKVTTVARPAPSAPASKPVLPPEPSNPKIEPPAPVTVVQLPPAATPAAPSVATSAAAAVAEPAAAAEPPPTAATPTTTTPTASPPEGRSVADVVWPGARPDPAAAKPAESPRKPVAHAGKSPVASDRLCAAAEGSKDWCTGCPSAQKLSAESKHYCSCRQARGETSGVFYYCACVLPAEKHAKGSAVWCKCNVNDSACDGN